MHMKGIRFLQGNIACAEGAIAAGCEFFGGYPITPSTEVAEWLSSRFPEIGRAFIQMEDEIASIAAVIGARWAGKKAMTATSGPGLSLMMENIGYSAMTETPIVIIDIQRGGPSTGQPTMAGQGEIMQAKWGSHGDYQPIAISPNSVQEMFDLTVECFNLAEKYRVPVYLLADEAVGHMREKVDLPETVETISAPLSEKDELPFIANENEPPKIQVFGKGYKVHVTGLTHDERGYPATDDPAIHSKLVNRLNNKIINKRNEIIKYEEKFTDDAEIVLISYGGTSRAVLEAVMKLREEGIKAGYFRLITIWPFPDERMKEMGDKSRLMVLEMNLGQILHEVRKYSNEVFFFPKIGGELHTPFEIIKKVKEVMK